MGRNLHHSIIEFFEKRMKAHSAVRHIRRMPNHNEVIYEIHRAIFADVVRVWLSDSYDFDEGDFLNKPDEIRAGDYILIARPEARTYFDVHSDSKIAIGKIGVFMGALNKRQMWKYELPSHESKISKARPYRSSR